MIRIGALTLGVAFGLAAPASAADQKVDIRFAAVAGDAPVACGQAIEGLGTTQRPAQLADLRFFVSDVKLIRRDGRAVAVKLGKDSAYRVTEGRVGGDADRSRERHGRVRGGGDEGDQRPRARHRRRAGKYVGLRWTVGVPFALNHSDAPRRPGAAQQRRDGVVVAERAQVHQDRGHRPGRRRGAGRRARSSCTSAARAAPATRRPGRPWTARPRTGRRSASSASTRRAAGRGRRQGAAGGHRRHGQRRRRARLHGRADRPGVRRRVRRVRLDWKADGTATASRRAPQTVFRAIAR